MSTSSPGEKMLACRFCRAEYYTDNEGHRERAERCMQSPRLSGAIIKTKTYSMDRDSAPTSVPKGLQFRVGLLVGLAVVLGTGFVLYALYARGVFEDNQHLTLIADNGDGVSIGMDLSF